VPRLRGARELLAGADVVRDAGPGPATGGWRTGKKPAVDLELCVDCLLCWIHCPDSAIVLDGGTLVGFDYDLCKGCEICAEMCPEDAIAMVAEKTALPAHGAVRREAGDGAR
jgi:2-oxoacid:acceptor oxidoreductase delta subunit (pyruvate/2-ketoisovalerate family)